VKFKNDNNIKKDAETQQHENYNTFVNFLFCDTSLFTCRSHEYGNDAPLNNEGWPGWQPSPLPAYQPSSLPARLQAGQSFSKEC